MSTHNIPFFDMKKKNTRSYSYSAAMGFFSKGLKNEFERAISVRAIEVLLYIHTYIHTYF